MKKRNGGFQFQTRMWYVLGLLVSLFVIFVRKNGINGINLGMDLAGGVKMTYLVDYSKYENQFKDNINELDSAKKRARDIIKIQVEERISNLGVANPEINTVMIGGKEYLIVALGGVPDVDAAKQVIGKTVELEFGLENTQEVTDVTKQERREFAERLLMQAQEGDMSLEQIGTTNGLKGVSYMAMSGSLAELPTLYQNKDILDTLATGTIAPTLAEGVFQDYPEELAQYGYVDAVGYTITRLISRRQDTKASYTSDEFSAIVTDAQKVTVSSPVMTQTGVAYYTGGKLIYPLAEILPNQSGLNLEIYMYEGTGADSAIMQIDAGETTDAVQSYKGRLSSEEIPLAIPGFAYIDGQTWTTIPAGSGSTLVKVVETKKTNQTLFEQYEYTTDKETANQLLSKLTNPMIYEVESLFVADKQPWQIATDSQGNMLNGGHFEYAVVGVTQFGEPTVDITFNEKGAKIFCDITAANIQKPLAIFVGGEIKTNAVIQDKICGGTTQISGSYSQGEAQTLAKDLNEGALPAPLILVQEEKVSPVLGALALSHIIWAGLIGVAAVMIYMTIVYGYRWALVALMVLIAFIIFMLAVLKMMGAVLGLSGLAAIILSLGMSVDATILVYERIIENHKHNQSIRDSIIDASRQSRSAVRDGNLSTGMIALLLVFMGVNIFRGFGTMMVLNILIVLLLLYPMIKMLSLHFIRKTK